MFDDQPRALMEAIAVFSDARLCYHLSADAPLTDQLRTQLAEWLALSQPERDVRMLQATEELLHTIRTALTG